MAQKEEAQSRELDEAESGIAEIKPVGTEHACGDIIYSEKRRERGKLAVGV